MLLGALIRELPDVFEAEVLTKLERERPPRPRAGEQRVQRRRVQDTALRLHENVTYTTMSIHCRAALRRLYDAAEMGRLDVLKWLWEREPNCRKFVLRTVYIAGQHGQKEILDWFYTLPREDFPSEVNDLASNPFRVAMRGAARGGHLELVKHLREKGCEWDERTCATAASEGHVHVLEYLRTNDCPWDSDACASAAGGDHLDTLKWLREHGCPWDEKVTAVAAQNGYFEMLKWLHEHGCPGWDAESFAAAVTYGSLKVLTWMHENGCPWDEGATEQAAMYDNLEILTWLHENGCPISEGACFEAVDNDSVGVPEVPGGQQVPELGAPREYNSGVGQAKAKG